MSCIKIVVPGVQATTGVASAVTALPVDSAGKPVKYVLVSPAAACVVLPGVAATAVTAVNGIYITPNYPQVLDVSGCSHLAHIQITAATTINISPVEG